MKKIWELVIEFCSKYNLLTQFDSMQQPLRNRKCLKKLKRLEIRKMEIEREKEINPIYNETKIKLEVLSRKKLK